MTPSHRRFRPLTLALVVAAIALPPLAALSIPATLRIPRSTQARRGAPPAQARFSHREHDRQRCYQCHPSVFPQALAPFTHAEMDAGKFCGACHDDRRAVAVNRLRCEVCHATP